MRPPHYLKANRNVELPSHVIFMDTETQSTDLGKGVQHAQLWFGWAAYVRRHRGLSWTPPRWHRFTESGSLWDFVESLCEDKKRVFVIAHNLAFDATVTQAIRVLRLRGWELKGAIVDDPPTVLRFRRDRKSLVLMDSLNVFRLSLAQVGAYIGRAKLPMPAPDAERSEWDDYCRGDVEVLIAAFQRYWSLVREWDLGNFQLTLPSQAFAAFRHRFMGEQIYIDDNGPALDLARAGYSGARTEVYQLGKLPGTVHCLDINSQYPAVMSWASVPTKLKGMVHRVSVTELDIYLGDYAGMAEVTLETDRPIYPVKWGGRLVFPVGTFRTVLATPELRRALSMGHIRKVHRLALYEHAVLFSEYVLYFWNHRLEAKRQGDETLSWLLKLMLNSLYGKFGQSGRVYEDRDLTLDDEIKSWVELDADTGEVHHYRQFGGLIQELSREGESRDSHPAIAAHVTSAGRSLLWSLMSTAGRENVYYCDTDSLFVNDEGLHRLRHHMDSGELGALKLEWSSDSVEIFGCKDYVVDGSRKIKGIRKNAEVLGSGVFVQDVFRGFKGMLRDGDLDRQLITRTRKVLTREYRKGTPDPTGRVLPLLFPLPEHQ